MYVVIISFYICVEQEKPLYEQALKRGIVSTRRWRIFGLLCRSMLLEMCAIELFRPLARREKLPFSPDLVGRSRETEFSAFIRGWKINHMCLWPDTVTSAFCASPFNASCVCGPVFSYSRRAKNRRRSICRAPNGGAATPERGLRRATVRMCLC